jgi:hypothetical protein
VNSGISGILGILGILGIEIRKPNIFFLSFPAANNEFFNFFFSSIRADRLRPRADGPMSARMQGRVRATRSCLRGRECIRADAIFTTSADGKTLSVGKTASAG